RLFFLRMRRTTDAPTPLATAPPTMPIARGHGGAARTVIAKEAVAVLPEASTAVQVTVVTPTRNVEPDGGSQPTDGEESTKSDAPTSKVSMAPVTLVASTRMLGGRVTAGSVVSRTVTVKEPLAEFPEESVAVHETVVGPRAKVEPEAGEQLTVGEGSTRS